jgi:rRNA maturation protein Nop10
MEKVYEEKQKLGNVVCPVCGRYIFEKWYDICPICGWENDEDQYLDPQSDMMANMLSLEEYRNWWNQKLIDNPNYIFNENDYPRKGKMICPICGEYTLKWDWDKCKVCGWENDQEQFEDHDRLYGNPYSFNDYKKWWHNMRQKNPNYIFKKEDLPKLGWNSDDYSHD